MKHKIEKISIAGFRGASQPASQPFILEFDGEKPIALIFGKNGTGKSTLVDAIECIATGSTSFKEKWKLGTRKDAFVPTLGKKPDDGPGAALRVSAPQMRRMLPSNPGLSRTLQRYYYVLMGQFFQTAACNSFHQVEQRLARWLLMTNDRSLTDHVQLTHQMLADLLGVQRSAITIAAGKLQRKKLIGYARGQVSILSRSGLEDACCECYGVRAGDHARQFARS